MQQQSALCGPDSVKDHSPTSPYQTCVNKMLIAILARRLSLGAAYFTVVLMLAMQPLQGNVLVSSADKQQKILQQKLFLLNNMITKGSTSKKIRKSGNLEAMQLLQKAEALYALANESIQQGDTEDAGQIINDAIRAISAAGSKAKGEKGSTAAERSRYKEILSNIESLQDSVENDLTSNVDLDPVFRLKKQANALTERDNYKQAIKKLNSAYQYIVTEISGNVKNTTVVYSLDFKTSKDEYDYEHRRYQGNRELITRMLFEYEDNPTRKLIVRYTEQADSTLKKAETLADVENHDEAVHLMEKANRELSRSLGMLGLRF